MTENSADAKGIRENDYGSLLETHHPPTVFMSDALKRRIERATKFKEEHPILTDIPNELSPAHVRLLRQRCDLLYQRRLRKVKE